MKRSKQTFNNLLRRYNKYLRKIANLRLANRNERRQAILAKHIERLYEQLMSLKITIQKGSLVATVAVGALAFAPQVVGAQNFGSPQTNPFGLTSVDYSYSKPIFVDLDGDGDLDIMSGENYYYGNFNYYENTGTNIAPAFAPRQTNPFGITPMGRQYGTPTFVDIDNDGDLDMIAGYGYYYDSSGPTYEYGGFVYYENTGNATSPTFATPIFNPFGLTEVGGSGYSAPTFADMDNDGDMDMISGNRDGDFKYYENTGTNISPAFSAPVTNTFGLTSIGYNNSTPSLVDIDGDGDFDLISGGYYVGYNYIGGFVYYENTGTNIDPAYAAPQINPFGLTDPGNPGGYTAPTVADLDGDGDLDLLTGIRNGDLIYYLGCSPSTATISPVATCSYTSPSGNIWYTNNTYMDTIPNASGCDSVITINLTVNPIANQTISSTSLIACDNGSATIDLTSQPGANYYLRDNTNDTIVDGPVAGTGSGISLNTGPVSSTMTYNVYSDAPSPSKSLNFDGNNDYVDAGTGVSLANNSFTIEFWAKKNVLSTGNDDHIIGLGETTSSNNALHIGFRGNNNFTFAFFGNDLDASSSFTNTNWNHWAVTFDATTKVRTIYQNGTLITNDLSASNFLGAGNLKIGRAYNATNNNFTGNIDEVRVWNVVRTISEISGNMNTCLIGNETGLLAYYQFEDGAGSSTLTDLTSNGNNGTLTNMDINSSWDEGTAVCSSCNIEMTQIVTVNTGQSTTGTTSPTACISYTSPSGNYVWTSSNTYMDTIPNLAGCDSVITVNLTINTVDTSTTTSGFDITSNQTGATYRWLDCNNSNSVIPSETGITYTATANGDYAVEVTVGSCTDTSACVSVTTVGLDELSLAMGNLKLYPNPTTGNVVLDLGVITNAQISILDIAGKEFYNMNNVNDKQVQILTEEFSKGVYFVKIQSNNQQKIMKLVKQ